MDNRIKQLQQKYRLLQNTISLIEDQLKCGIIDYADATEQVDNMTKQERKLIKEAIDIIHVSKNGTPRKISFDEKRSMYYTLMPNKQQIHAKSMDALYEKLFCAYGLSLNKGKYTIGKVFELAFERKKANSTNKTNSFKRNLNTFKTYFTNEFSKRDITKITKDDLLAYTKYVCATYHPSKKEFLAYKGILNLIFEYAFDKDIRPDNPVPCIHNEDYYKDGYCNCITRESEDNIFSVDQINKIRDALRIRNSSSKFKGYDINGYAINLSTYTGVRVGELCALKWNDIEEFFIWIHAQIVEGDRTTGQAMAWNYCPYTKNERKKSSKTGRHFPLNDEIRMLLNEIKQKQLELGIYSEDGYIFIRENGEPINPNSYSKSLKKLMDKLGYHVTNNHAFRKSVNSNILIPMGLDEVQRADLLGHSPEVNLNNYTYKRLDDTNEIYQRFNHYTNVVKPELNQNVVEFNSYKKEKVLRNQYF